MWTRRLVLLLAASLAGCQEMVQLGTECPDGDACRDSAVVARPDSGAISTPLADVDAGAMIVLPTGDASLNVGTNAEFPFIGDPGFELQDGGPGGVAAFNISLDPNASQPVFEPWQACQIVKLDLSALYPAAPDFAAIGVASDVDVGTPSNPKQVKPFEGASLVTVSFPPALPAGIVRVPLSQKLATPMQQNTRYALSLRTLRVDQGAEYKLQVYGSDTRCFYPIEDPPWVEVPIPTSSEWSKVCLTFTAPSDAQHFLLVATSSAVVPTATTTLAFLLDDIQSDPECAGVQ